MNYEYDADRDVSIEACCEEMLIERTGSGCDEADSWGCYTCRSCKAAWLLYANRYKVWERQA